MATTWRIRHQTRHPPGEYSGAGEVEPPHDFFFCSASVIASVYGSVIAPLSIASGKMEKELEGGEVTYWAGVEY